MFKRLIFAVSVLLGIVLVQSAFITESGVAQDKKTITWQDKVQPSQPVVTQPGTNLDVEAAALFPRREVGILQARRAGITLSSVRESMRRLKEAGEIDKDSSRGEIAIAVTADLQQRNQQAFSSEFGEVGTGAVDWDAIFAFIEKLIKLIMTILPLFLGMVFSPNRRNRARLRLIARKFHKLV